MDRPPGFPEAEWQKHLEREQELTAASAAPLPGPLRQAFAGEPQTICGLRLRPMTLGDAAVLARLDLPLLEAVRIAVQNADKPEEERRAALERFDAPRPGETQAQANERQIVDCIVTLFVFTLKPDDARKLLREFAPDKFRDMAMDAISHKLRPGDLPKIQSALLAIVLEGFSTAVEMAPESSGGSGSFQSPPAGPVTV